MNFYEFFDSRIGNKLLKGNNDRHRLVPDLVEKGFCFKRLSFEEAFPSLKSQPHRLVRLIKFLPESHNRELEPYLLKGFAYSPITVTEYFHKHYGNKRVAELEDKIIDYPTMAIKYALMFKMDKFELLEKKLLSNSKDMFGLVSYFYDYANSVLQSRWKEAEEELIRSLPNLFAIESERAKRIYFAELKNTYSAIYIGERLVNYSVNILKEPWPEVEEYIQYSEQSWTDYTKHFSIMS